MCIHTVDPYDDEEFDQDSDDVSPDTGPEYDRELDFNPRFGWSILDEPRTVMTESKND